ncbi:DegT/DnrJ/EryC1/StrS family aminotransferase [Kamptonema formosum]|uniref:DegT/DnrJ/EryC1/StrS family aminotransferase n=1 Tax=Kamptonema formosum TaxID=331992 RepID=UPI000374470B|nr:DegT/DnrJ/EryC1/StrS family aminotransferase [Oscillatoria sp. PCC 10802]
MNNIPPLDLAQQYQTISEEVSQAVLEVLASGRYIGGPPVLGFERQFAAYLGVEECVACNSGTDALYLALRALKIGPSDEVITTPFTFIATAEAIALVGARPVFVDIDPLTYNLDLNLLPAAITGKTRAILPVHLFGLPVDMTGVMAIAESRGLAVIEDCAQATGAEWAGRKAGSIGHAGCFSFFPTKNLGACGDGGAVTTNDPALAQAIRTLKEHGSSRRYYHEETGINSRLDAVQAAILQVKLPYLDTWNDLRRQVAARYRQLLAPLADIILPQEPPGGRSVWNQYTIRLLGNRLDRASHSTPGSYRDLVRNRLLDRGTGSMVYYPLPLHLQPVYAGLGYQAGDLPVAERVAAEVLSLPIFPELSPEQQAQVVCTLKDCLAVPAPLTSG